jgi:dTDP-4-dehydrorhamnose reductase
VKNKHPLPIWGGVEPTINRVGDCHFQQLAFSCHRERLSDLDRFAELGLRTLRFPILWEEVAPDSPDECHWSRIDAQVRRMQELGITPIAGLLHHGSGPRYTSLTDPAFPEKLAAFARAVAGRYPHIASYTPVNEPLTTARFSGLYGLWFPHARDEQTFARCLINQLRGTVLAMRAIREINPAAALVQTDDLGKTHSTPRLRYQADYENERRWLTWDILRGELTPAARMWQELRRAGIDEHELAFFAENPCPPDILGANYYITSERFLDENLAAHPPETHGGNAIERYADRAAVRVRREGITGTAGLLRELWERYRSPIAVTEAHIGCTRDEQLRWLHEICTAAGKLQHEGADVRAVTVWSLLGAFNWNTLLTRDDGEYEPGVFDLSDGDPRPTAVATMVRELAHGRAFDHPVLAAPGWWRRSIRLLDPRSNESECLPRAAAAPPAGAAELPHGMPPIALICADEQLAEEFRAITQLRGLACTLAADPDAWAVIDCSAVSRLPNLHHLLDSLIDRGGGEWLLAADGTLLPIGSESLAAV